MTLDLAAIRAAAVRETHAVLDERHYDVAGDGTLPKRARRVCDALEASCWISAAGSGPMGCG